MPLLSRMRAPGSGQHPHTIAVIGALAGVGAILIFLILGSAVPPPSAPGVVHTTEIKIAPEISGRLSRFAVTLGQGVRAGDELATLVNPELSASLVLATAELGQARAQRDNVYAGIRQEEVDTLEREIETAKADLLYAEQQFARKSALAADGFASRQDLDEASAAVGTARARLEHAQEAYEAARLGPIREELAVADAKVKNAEAVVSVTAARVEKLHISAPSDGTVALIVAEPGEAIVPGQPVMTLEAAGRRWASFNLREDHPARRVCDLARRARGRRPRSEHVPRSRRPGRGGGRFAAGNDGLAGTGEPLRAVSLSRCFLSVTLWPWTAPRA